MSALSEFAGRTSEWIEFLLKEAFWWVFEEATVVCCTTVEQSNWRKEAALFWRSLPSLNTVSSQPTLELFILFCEAPTERHAQFLLHFYAEFASCLQELVCPQTSETGLFQVHVTIEATFDFIRKNFSEKRTGFSERIAWLKLKPIAGASTVSREIEQARLAYVFSQKPIQFSDAALERVRSQPAASLLTDVRLSAGGLLDIEYLVAVLQLSYGREIDGDIRSGETLTALFGLWQAGVLGEKHYQDIRAAYVFLTGLAGVLEYGGLPVQGTQLPEINSETYLQAARQMGYLGPDTHAHAEFRLACQHHMSGADRLYTNTMVNLANQPWEEIPATVVVTEKSVRVRLDELLRGEPRPEDVPALRRMGFTQLQSLGKHFQALCPNRTAFEPFSRVIEKSWALWPEIPSPDLALRNLKRFAEKNEDPYRFWYALAKSDKGLRLLLHIFGTSQLLSDLFLENRDAWPWVEQTQFLGVSQTLDLLRQPDFELTTLEDLNRFRDREILRLALTDFFMEAPFDSLMTAHSHVMIFALEQLARFLPDTRDMALLGLSGTGAGASPLGSEWNMMVVARDEAALSRGREWLEKVTGGAGNSIWARLGPPDENETPAFLLTLSALLSRISQTQLLSQAAPWLQMKHLAGSADLSQSVLDHLQRVWRGTGWLEPSALTPLMAERRVGHERLESRHESERDLMLAPGGLRDIEWVVTAAWARRARENFQPCGLLEMLTAVEAGGILPSSECVVLREAFLDYQKIRSRVGFALGANSTLLPIDGEEFCFAAKAAGYRAQGIHAAETFFQQRLLRLRENVLMVFESFFKEAL